MGLKRLLKKTVKVAFAPTRAIVKGVKRNSEYIAPAIGLGLTAATGGAAGGLLGTLGGIFGGGAPAPYEPPAPDPAPPPAPELAEGFDKKTLLLAGGAVAAAVLLSR